MRVQKDTRERHVLRSLANYIARHRDTYPEVVNARTLTEARRICFGVHQSMHGMLGKEIHDK
jgi:hypothetical protein